MSIITLRVKVRETARELGHVWADADGVDPLADAVTSWIHGLRGNTEGYPR